MRPGHADERDVAERIASAIRAHYARSTGPDGAPPDYRFAVTRASPDGSEFTLNLTFKAGSHYCCFEAGCHLGLFEADDWRRIRACLRREGIAPEAPIVIRAVHVVVEEGAVATRYPVKTLPEHQAWTYGVGPFEEPVA